jgi:Ca2+-binding RTX toxin-like protein
MDGKCKTVWRYRQNPAERFFALRVDKGSMSPLEPLERRALLAAISFEAPLLSSIGGDPSAGVTADFNGDGKNDLATANSNGSVSILIGTGTGGFQSAQTISDGLPDGPVRLMTADVNGDGHADLIVAGGNAVSVLPGNGDGSFKSPKITSLGFVADDIALGDVNGDNHLDLIAAKNDGGLAILIGNNDGTFKPADLLSDGLAPGPAMVDAVDLAGNNKLDLLAVSGNTVGILLGNGNNTFSLPTTFTANGDGDIDAMAVADFNDDSKPDLALAIGVGDTLQIDIALNDGDGSFSAGQVINAGHYYPNTLTTCGLSGDGQPDLVVVDQVNQSEKMLVFPGNNDGSFGSATTVATFNAAQFSLLADLNGDGKPDLIVGYSSNNVGVFINNSDIPSIFITDGIITGAGTSGADTAVLSYSSGNVVISIDGDRQSFAIGSIDAINLNMFGGADSVVIGLGVPAVNVNGGGGADTIVANNNAADTLRGGLGNDSISGGGGDDVLDGGAGNDTLVAGTGNDTLTGDAGNDSLVGGPGLDLLLGGDGNDTLAAGAGNNTLRGNAGNDFLIGTGGGSDLLAGNGGDDTLIGATGGDAGIDTLRGGAGIDSIIPGPHDSVSAD